MIYACIVLHLVTSDGSLSQLSALYIYTTVWPRAWPPPLPPPSNPRLPVFYCIELCDLSDSHYLLRIQVAISNLAIRYEDSIVF